MQADAVGGVIYIITKSFAAKQNQKTRVGWAFQQGIRLPEYDAGFFYSKQPAHRRRHINQ